MGRTARPDLATLSSLIAIAKQEVLVREVWSLSLTRRDDRRGWVAVMEFGRRPHGSRLAPGAAYGVGTTPEHALNDALAGAGWEPLNTS